VLSLNDYFNLVSNKYPIFINPELQLKFEQDGYVKIKLLDESQATALYDYYINHQKDHDIIDGLYQSTTHTNNPELILEIDRQIKAVLLPELGKYFQNYEPMMCTYITKQPGEGSETILHQDPTFVDESQFVSANVWVALHDINHDNGNLFFVNGTHRIIPSLRVTPTCPTAFDSVKDLLKENITEVPVKRGEAILINHAVVHGATPNFSTGPRIAAVMAIRSAASNWIYHYLEPGAEFDKIEKYEVSLDTFVHLKKDGRPDFAKFAGHVQWHFPQISAADFNTEMRKQQQTALSFSSVLNKLSVVKDKLFSNS